MACSSSACRPLWRLRLAVPLSSAIFRAIFWEGCTGVRAAAGNMTYAFSHSECHSEADSRHLVIGTVLSSAIFRAIMWEGCRRRQETLHTVTDLNVLQSG
jgi:hypothetical protein